MSTIIGEIPYTLEDMEPADSVRHLAEQRRTFFGHTHSYIGDPSDLNHKYVIEAIDDLEGAMELVLCWVNLEPDPETQAAILTDVLLEETEEHIAFMSELTGNAIEDFRPRDKSDVKAEIMKTLRDNNTTDNLQNLYDSYRGYLGGYRQVLSQYRPKSAGNVIDITSKEPVMGKRVLAVAGVGLGLIAGGVGAWLGNRARQR